jgi:hypothetical protein
MRRSTVILLGAMVGFALLTPVQEAVAQQTRGNGDGAVTYQVRNDRMYTLASCGDVVDIAGWVEIKRVEVARGRDNSGYAWHVNGKGSGEGLISGAKYNWHQNTLMRVAGSEWDGHYSNQTNTRTRVIGQGNAPDYSFTLHTFINKNSNGEVTARFHVSDITCR